MVFSALVIIFLFLKRWGQVPNLRSLQYVTFKYGDFGWSIGWSVCHNFPKGREVTLPWSIYLKNAGKIGEDERIKSKDHLTFLSFAYTPRESERGL